MFQTEFFGDNVTGIL